MNWKQQWINEVLEEIPAGSYRKRAEAELYDHLETQCHALMEAGRTQDQARKEILRVMGEPEALQKEYAAAWRRSWPARLEELVHRLLAWAGGLAIMWWVQYLGCCAADAFWSTVLNLDSSSFFRDLFALLCALIAGAFFLSRLFQTSRRPAVLISAGLFFHWASFVALGVSWEALDDHRTFLEELILFLTYNAGYCALALTLCVLLGVVFGHMSGRRQRLSAA